MSRHGYSPYAILKIEPTTARKIYAPYTDLMREVKAGFGRTMSHLPAVFGVSRQTLYNWLSGEIPKEQHQSKLVQLAAAARVFTSTGFKPTALSLDRTVAHGQSFIELIGQGADGKGTAERLIRIEKRGASAREKLDALLGERSPSRPDIADLGRPVFNENV
jgi:transcriptional regulator with XRE-family HTH domain